MIYIRIQFHTPRLQYLINGRHKTKAKYRYGSAAILLYILQQNVAYTYRLYTCALSVASTSKDRMAAILTLLMSENNKITMVGVASSYMLFKRSY
jgi:hypothetical protein